MSLLSLPRTTLTLRALTCAGLGVTRTTLAASLSQVWELPAASVLVSWARLRRLSYSLPISPATAMISASFGVTSSVAVLATEISRFWSSVR